VWEKNHFTSKHLSDFFVLDWFGKNMLHDEYAKEVINDLDQEGITRFSTYSHSQGGAVATHLRSYYMYGMDAVVCDVRIV